jgi:cytochrome o ubiquinol oxidase subunit 2
MNRRYLLPVIAFAVLAAFAITVAYYVHGLPIPVLEPQGPVAAEERWVMLVTVLLCAVVVVPVFILLFFFAWKYRATSGKAPVHHDPNWDHDSLIAELVWWLVPAAIIFVLAVIAWRSTHALDPYVPLAGNEPPLTVEVVALDWKWLFVYPDQGIATVNTLTIPEDRPVHFYLTADAPMNSFRIPALGGQIMVMPGMTTQMNLAASTTGAWNGLSGNISGAGFAGMTFTVRSVPGSDFDAWVASVRTSSSTPLTEAQYDALAKPSSYMPARAYPSVAPELYNGILEKYMGPMNGTGGMMPMEGMDMGASSTP